MKPGVWSPLNPQHPGSSSWIGSRGEQLWVPVPGPPTLLPRERATLAPAPPLPGLAKAAGFCPPRSLTPRRYGLPRILRWVLPPRLCLGSNDAAAFPATWTLGHSRAKCDCFRCLSSGHGQRAPEGQGSLWTPQDLDAPRVRTKVVFPAPGPRRERPPSGRGGRHPWLLPKPGLHSANMVGNGVPHGTPGQAPCEAGREPWRLHPPAASVTWPQQLSGPAPVPGEAATPVPLSVWRPHETPKSREAEWGVPGTGEG